MKKMLSLLLAGVLLLGITGCSGKNSYKKKLDIDIAAEPTSIYALEEEMTQIAHEYDPEVTLIKAVAVFKGETEIKNQKGTIDFTFCRDDKEAEKIVTVVLTYNMFDQKVTNVNYKQKSSFFSSVTIQEIEAGSKAVTFQDIFTQLLPMDSSLYKKLDGKSVELTIEFSADGLKPSVI